MVGTRSHTHRVPAGVWGSAIDVTVNRSPSSSNDRENSFPIIRVLTAPSGR